MAAPHLRSNSVMLLRAAAAVVVILAVTGLRCANAERTIIAPLNLRDCDPYDTGLYVEPSRANCPTVLAVIPVGSFVHIYCTTIGEDILGNNLWLLVQYEYYKPAYVSDYYVDCDGPCSRYYPPCVYPR